MSDQKTLDAKKSLRVGRPAGTAKARKPIRKRDFDLLQSHLTNNKNIKKAKRESLRKCLYLLYFGGFRISETVRLTNKDIHDAILEGVIHLPNNSKTKIAREVYLSDFAVETFKVVFKANLEEEPIDAVVLRPWGSYYEYYNPAALTFSLNELLSSVLGKQYTSHSFRAGYITDMAHSEVDIKTIQENIGHKKAATTMGYITVREEDKRRAVAKVR